MNPGIFDNFKNENLTPLMIVLKRIGQVCLFILAACVLVTQLNHGQVGGTPFLDSMVWAGGFSFFVGIACFAIVGLYSLGKSKNNNTVQATGKSLLKILLLIYVPAIVITAILTFTIILSRYQ